jgi:Acetyltransferase (GNAT) domain
MAQTEIRAGSIQPYEHARLADWDELVARSVNGTFLHSRRFLAYHADRFRDCSLLITDARRRVVGVFPAAADPADPRMVTSHPGLTYGGLVHDGSLSGGSMVRVLGEMAGYYRSVGFTRLRYKAVPYIYHSAPAADDVYGLFRLGARRDGCDLAAVIDLARRGEIRADRRRARRRAEDAGVRVERGWQNAVEFWQILEANLAGRHGAAPTHSLAQIQDLHERFPDEVLLVAAKSGAALLGGCVFLATSVVLQGQYLAASSQGRAVHATDPAIENGIQLARERGCRYVSFGTSTYDRGARLNESQYDFKSSFGARGVVHDHYELAL